MAQGLRPDKSGLAPALPSTTAALFARTFLLRKQELGGLFHRYGDVELSFRLFAQRHSPM